MADRRWALAALAVECRCGFDLWPMEGFWGRWRFIFVRIPVYGGTGGWLATLVSRFLGGRYRRPKGLIVVRIGVLRRAGGGLATLEVVRNLVVAVAVVGRIWGINKAMTNNDLLVRICVGDSDRGGT